MRYASQGEHIARVAFARMNGIGPVQEPSKGCPLPLRSLLRRRRGRNEGRVILWGAAGAGFDPPEKARERRPGEILAKVFVAGPRREKPKGASSGWRAKHTLGRQGLLRGSKPRNRGLPSRPCVSAQGIPVSETVGGCSRVETPRLPLERRRLRRVNPMSAAGAKQNRQGLAGRKPSRG
jgi:hypothetical protein